MTSTHVGLICLLLFVTSQGVRDAYFGSIFQTVSFLLVAAMAFGLSSIFFTLWSLLRKRGPPKANCFPGTGIGHAQSDHGGSMAWVFLWSEVSRAGGCCNVAQWRWPARGSRIRATISGGTRDCQYREWSGSPISALQLLWRHWSWSYFPTNRACLRQTGPVGWARWWSSCSAVR